jgi:hypothetical protein
MPYTDSAKAPLDHRSHRPVCPQCNGEMERIARRLPDRFVSLFVPVHRYRCRSASCAWVGNVQMHAAILPIARMTPELPPENW